MVVITLRQYSDRYINDIIDIVARSLNEHYDPSIYKSLSQFWPDGFIVATLDNIQAVGFLLGVIIDGEETRILMFAVKEGYRNNGIGKMLMNTFLQYSSNIGARRVSLEVRVSNNVAINFYTKFGFTKKSILPHYYSDGEDGYQMVKYM